MSAVLEIPRTITSDDLLDLPKDGFRYEIVRGELRKKMPSGILHALIAGRIAGLLSGFIRQRRLGEILTAEPGFKLSLTPETLRVPDVSFMRMDKFLQIKNLDKFYSGAPNLAVEVISPSETFQDEQEKIEDYLASGVEMIWIVRPKQTTITVYRPQHELTVLRIGDSLDGADVIPGFTCSVEDILGDLPEISEE